MPNALRTKNQIHHCEFSWLNRFLKTSSSWSSNEAKLDLRPENSLSLKSPASCSQKATFVMSIRQVGKTGEFVAEIRQKHGITGDRFSIGAHHNELQGIHLF